MRSQTGGVKPRPWTTAELAELRALAAAGAGIVAVAAALDRTERAVRAQAVRQRISLRTAGERRGSILGELPHRRLPAELRTAALVGLVDQHTAEARARMLGADLCPDCAARPIATRSGLCDVCYYRRLAAAHRDELAIISSRREADAARAMKYRARKRQTA